MRVDLDADGERRRLRTARLLTLLAAVHVIFPLAALGIVSDAAHLASDRCRRLRRQGRG